MVALTDTTASLRKQLAKIPVTEADLLVIRDMWGSLESGYHNVYRKHRGRSLLWQARPYSSGGCYPKGIGGAAGRKGRGGPRILAGTFRTPREAAKCVIQWYKLRFGEAWATTYRKKTHNPWFARQVPDGWQLVVRVHGEPVVVPWPAGVLPSRKAVAAYYRRWRKMTFGTDAWLAVRRG